MKQKINRLIRHKFHLLALLASSSVFNAATNVADDITSNTTWNKAGSPYILKDYIFVKRWCYLTIDAGVLFKLRKEVPMVHLHLLSRREPRLTLRELLMNLSSLLLSR